MPKDGVITEAEWQWLADFLKKDDDWERGVWKPSGVSDYMRGVKPKKLRRYPMFHKDLTKRIERLEDRVNKFESRLENLKKELREAAYYEYCHDDGYFTGPLRHEMPASMAIEKILNHLHLTFECEPAKEKECHLVSSLPKRKPKKPKKKAKKKK